MPRLVHRLAFVVLVSLAACGREPAPAPSAAGTAQAGAMPAELAGGEADAQQDGWTLPDDRPAWPLPDEILSPWETGLLVMDTHHLTGVQRRQRAYARRKAMMLNPDSGTARVLEDLAKAAEAGELDPQGGSQVVFTARGVERKSGGSPPAGSRPPAGAELPAPGADAPAPDADGSR